MSASEFLHDQIMRFGGYRLATGARELRKQRSKIKLQEQAFQLLMVLLERPGEVVSRGELREKLWPAVTVSDFDHSLNKAMNKLRRALSDSCARPRFIETVPKRGYRFIAPVSPDSRVGGAQQQKVRVAVLPFRSLGSDGTQEYLADEITEEIISGLGHVLPERLAIIARTSTMRYQGTPKRASEIGRELNADYLVEGSVCVTGKRICVTARLIDCRTETQVWAEMRRCELAGISAQARLTAFLTRSLARRLLGQKGAR